MPSPAILNQGLVGRALPSASPDSINNSVALRLDRYGGAFATAPSVGKSAWAEEGSYFVARTPTPGTGVVYNVQTTFVETVPLIFGNNTSTTKNCWLDRLKLVITEVGGSATTFQYAVKIDSVARSITTNHVVAAVPACPNLGAGTTSVMNIWYQSSSTASALNASSAAAIVVAEGSIGGLQIVSDEYNIEFGQRLLAGGSGLTAVQATDPAVKCSSAGPVIVAPGGSFCIHLWLANMGDSLSYSFELGMREV